MASRNVSTDRRPRCSRRRERERETIGIAIDLADCAVGMSPACLPASPPPLSIGALMVVDPSGSNHHLAVAEQAGRPTEGEVSPLINHGRVSKQTEMSWWDAPLPATLPISLMLFSLSRGLTGSGGDDVFIMGAREIKPYSRPSADFGRPRCRMKRLRGGGFL